MGKQHLDQPSMSLTNPVSRRFALRRVAAGSVAVAVAIPGMVVNTEKTFAQDAQQTEDQAKTIVQRFYGEVLNALSKVDQAAQDQIVSPDFSDTHNGFVYPSDNLFGLEGYRTLLEAFPDMAFTPVTPDRTIARDDLVMAFVTFKGTHNGEFFGHPGSGLPVSVSGLDLFRLAGGRLVEHWGYPDISELLKQIGYPVVVEVLATPTA